VRPSPDRIFVAGASGFVGRHLVPALVARGREVVATSRRARARQPQILWTQVDLEDEPALERSLRGVAQAVFLIHGLARGKGFADWERRLAERFARAAEAAGVQRIVYLGGLAPAGRPSPHLASRLQVGRLLRAGKVPTVELRASMIIGPESASWIVIRDLALRLPWMITPLWVRHRTQPVAVEDVVEAVIGALDPRFPAPAVEDLPGPETISVAELLVRVAARRGLRDRMLPVPLLSPRLSSYWLRLVTRAEYPVARELVLGLTSDVLARDDSAWARLGHPQRLALDEAIDRALAAEPPGVLPLPGSVRLEAWLSPSALESLSRRSAWRPLARAPRP
jgi:uncharacterized protein YbjT (DUF2867 family)